MSTFFLSVAVLLTVIMLIPFYRVKVGPTVFDRLLGAGGISSKTVALVALIGTLFGRLDMFVDIILAYAILNFMILVAVGEYFEQGSRKTPGVTEPVEDAAKEEGR